MLLETLGVRSEPYSSTESNNKQICFRMCHSLGFLRTGKVKNSYKCLLNQFPGKNPFIPDDKLSFLLSQPVAFLIHTLYGTLIIFEAFQKGGTSRVRHGHTAADEIWPHVCFECVHALHHLNKALKTWRWRNDAATVDAFDLCLRQVSWTCLFSRYALVSLWQAVVQKMSTLSVTDIQDVGHGKSSLCWRCCTFIGGLF